MRCHRITGLTQVEMQWCADLLIRQDTQTRDEIERLIAGDEILKEIHQELTYNELDSSIEVMLG